MAQGTTVLKNGTDTWAGEREPSANHGDSRLLWLESGYRNAYLYFNRPFPLGATIVRATLWLYTADSWGNTPTITARRIADRWGVNRLTWNNKPDVKTTTYPRTKSSIGEGDAWDIDVTAMLQAVSDGATWFGIRIATDDTTPRAFYSANGPADYRPVLEVVWSRAPQAPTTLSPSGTRAVSIGKPTLRFDFTDHSGSTALQAVHVQIDPTGNWGAPAWDSGHVLSEEPELDLSTTTYPGLTGGQETRWRVRVQDGVGLWSPWSDPSWFRRDNKGTLTIDNPAAPPNDFVSEWTPPITWTLTGETQRAWQVVVTDPEDRTVHLHNTGRTRGTDVSWTLPKGVIEDDSDYRLIVRVWDSKDREHTPGDPVYTQAERVFRFREDPTPNPVSNLAVSNLLPRPWAELTWERGTAPDRFVVKRNGRVIDSDLDPARVNVSGTTTYRWVDKDAKPYREHTWVVQAVVNRLTSANNPSITTRVKQQGIWLVDPDRDLDVFINADEEGTWAMGEEATTHHPVGSKHGVRVTQSLRGYEGTVNGILAADLGHTPEWWEDRLFKMKARPGEPLILSLGNESMRVVIGNVVSHPTPTVPITKRVSFDFWQVGALDFRPRL